MMRSAAGSLAGKRSVGWLLLSAGLFAGAVAACADETGTSSTLCELINLGLERQPALAAARASLAAADSGLRGVQGLRFGAILAKDLPIRKQQSCLGVTIAAAGLQQAEWDTRYAVIRNYYSVIYAREQLKVVLRVKEKLDESLVQAKKLVKAGDPDIKVTQVDVDVLGLNLELLKAKEVEARIGISKAFAALREAIGVGLEYPLEITEERFPPVVADLNKESLIAMALANRGDLAQAAAAQEVIALEISAQRKLRGPTGRTFAQGSDLHAKPIPQGVSNGEYRPGAIGPEMPTTLVGRKSARVEHAGDLNSRAVAVVDKTTNLITLEVEATYLKWQEAADKIRNLGNAPRIAADISKNVKIEFDKGKVPGEALLRAQGMEEQIVANYNEGLYLHALSLAALERVTAGGYRMTACATCAK